MDSSGGQRSVLLFEEIFIQGQSCSDELSDSQVSPVLETEHRVEEGVESAGDVIKDS